MSKLDNRIKIRQIVGLAPGIHMRGVERMAGLSFTTVRYHVRRLEEAGDIEIERRGKYERLFPRGMSEREREMASVIRNKSDWLVLNEIVRGQRMTNGEISRGTGLAKSTVSKHIHILAGLGIVQRKRPGSRGAAGYEVGEGVLSSLVRLAGARLGIAVGRYVELWDF